MHPSNQDEIGQSEWGYQVESAKASDAKGMFPTRIEECSCAYGELYQAFLSELSSLKGKISCANFLRKCKDLLYEYCWCIPSATNDYLNDISLYDHSVTTMSIALALGNSDNAKKPFRLLACDVSGIQSFIFQSKNQSFKGAATTIRGRSMLISALSTAYQVGLAEKLDLIPFMCYHDFKEPVIAKGTITIMDKAPTYFSELFTTVSHFFIEKLNKKFEHQGGEGFPPDLFAQLNNDISQGYGMIRLGHYTGTENKTLNVQQRIGTKITDEDINIHETVCENTIISVLPKRR